MRNEWIGCLITFTGESYWSYTGAHPFQHHNHIWFIAVGSLMSQWHLSSCCFVNGVVRDKTRMIGVYSLSSFGCQSWWRSAVSHPAVCLMCCAIVWWSEMLSCSGSVMAGSVGVVLAARCWWSLPLCLWMHCLLGSHGNGKTGNNAELWNRDFQALKSYENFCRLWIYIYFLVMLSFRIEWKNGASCHTEDLSLSLAHMCVFSISGFKSTSSKPSSKLNIFLIII